jgi:hypothetical protein
VLDRTEQDRRKSRRRAHGFHPRLRVRVLDLSIADKCPVAPRRWDKPRCANFGLSVRSPTPIAKFGHRLWINGLLAIWSVRRGMPRWGWPAHSIDISDLCGAAAARRRSAQLPVRGIGRRVRAGGLFAGWSQCRIGINGRPASWLSFANNSPRAPASFFADAP